jgi:hypothetical protein
MFWTWNTKRGAYADHVQLWGNPVVGSRLLMLVPCLANYSPKFNDVQIDKYFSIPVLQVSSSYLG